VADEVEIQSSDLEAVEEDSLDNPDVDEKDVVESDDTPEEEKSEETEKSEKETDTEDEEGDDEYIDDFDEWAKQYNLPEGINSPETLAESYAATLPEMKRAQSGADRLKQVDAALQASGVTVEDVLSGRASLQQRPSAQPATALEKADGKSYFNAGAMSDWVESAIKAGTIQNTEEFQQEGFYRTLANVVDNAYGKQFAKAEKVYSVFTQHMANLQKQIRDISWGGLDKDVRGAINRREADKLLDAGLDGIGTYDDAIRFMSFRNPELLREITQKAEQRGKEKGRKRLRRNKALRRSKESAPAASKWDYEKYLGEDGNWDHGKMNALSLDDQAKMVEAFEKEHFKKKK
jgi:hypothetical protein